MFHRTGPFRKPTLLFERNPLYLPRVLTPDFHHNRPGFPDATPLTTTPVSKFKERPLLLDKPDLDEVLTTRIPQEPTFPRWLNVPGTLLAVGRCRVVSKTISEPGRFY